MVTRVSSPAFIGRGTELSRFAAALSEARAGRPAIFLVAGEAGVGKTRFLGEVAGRARAEGAYVLEGGCIQLGAESLPFGPIVEILRDLANDRSPADLANLFGSDRSLLAGLVPGFSTRRDTVPAASPVDGGGQGRLFEGLLSLLGHIASDELLLLLILEDLHWADRSTLELLVFLVRNLRESPIVLAASYRSDELHRRHPLRPVLAELERGGRAQRVELARFERAELAAQLNGILGDRPEPDLVELIFSRSEGNPFYAEELLATGASSARLGETLRDLLLARIGTLSDRTQEVLRIASAAGATISRAVLAPITGLRETSLDAAFREAVDQQVLARLEDYQDERYAFRHALVREAVYSDLLAGERGRLHARFAAQLASAAAADADAFRAAELAHHWSMAHDLPRAFDASIQAGVAAQTMYAYREATGQFERALELWDRVPDAAARAPLDRIGLLERAARVSWDFAPASSIGYANAALALVNPIADPGRAALLHGMLSGAKFQLLDDVGALAALRDGVQIVPADRPSVARAKALDDLARMLAFLDRHTESLAICERAIGMARAVGARPIEDHALNTRGMNQAALGDIEAGLATIELARAIATEFDTSGRVNETWIFQSDVLSRAGRFDEAAAAGLKAADHASTHGLATILGGVALGVAFNALFAVGRWDEAADALVRAQRSELHAIAEFEVEECLARLELARGEFRDSGSRLERLRSLAVGVLLPRRIAPLATSLAEHAIWRGDPEAAREAVRDAMRKMDLATEVWVGHIGPVLAVGIRAEVEAAARAAARGSNAEAAAAKAAGGALLGRMEIVAQEIAEQRPTYAPQATAWQRMCEAEALHLTGAEDPDRWAAAGAAWARLRMPYQQAYAQLREGEAALLRHDRRRAASALDAGRLLAIRLIARPLERKIEGLASRAGMHLGAAADLAAPALPEMAHQRTAAPAATGAPGAGSSVHRGRHDLTPREREVLKLVAAGRSDAEIAATLFISPKTASVHVANIKGKLGAASRVAIATDAIRLGLLDISR